MLVNSKTAIVGSKVVLVPYRCVVLRPLLPPKTSLKRSSFTVATFRHEHVEKYHEWMLSPELRELTASEPLTLEEEYAMQKSWQNDEDKLTFIILARSPCSHEESDAIPTNYEIRTYQMIGDVNLFFKGTKLHPSGVENLNIVCDSDPEFEVEAEVMLAEPFYRRKGLASEALSLLFGYATSPLGPEALRLSPQNLVVRIGESNLASIHLFEKLGFVIFKRVEVFQEVEMRLQTDHVPKWIEGKVVEFE